MVDVCWRGGCPGSSFARLSTDPPDASAAHVLRLLHRTPAVEPVCVVRRRTSPQSPVAITTPHHTTPTPSVWCLFYDSLGRRDSGCVGKWSHRQGSYLHLNKGKVVVPGNGHLALPLVPPLMFCPSTGVLVHLGAQ